MTIDLASIYPRSNFETPGLGLVSADIDSGRLVQWFRRADQLSPWPDGETLMRRLLVEHAVRPSSEGEGGDVPISEEDVSPLTSEQIDAGAGALTAAAGDAFLPKLIEDPRAPEGVRDRHEQEAYDPTLQEGERQSERLLRLLREAALDGRLHRRRRNAILLKELSPTLKVLQDLKNSPSYQLAEAARRYALRDEGIVRAARDLTTVRDSLALKGPLADTLRQLDEIKKSWRIFQPPEVQGALAQQSSLQRMAQLFKPPAYASGLEANLRAIAVLNSRAGALAQASSRFSLDLSPSVLSAMAAYERMSEDSRIAEEALETARTIAPFVRPGWQATVTAGLAGAAPDSVVAAALDNYDADDPGDPFFSAALSGIQVLDEPADQPISGLLQALAELYEAYLRRWNSTRDGLSLEAAIAIFALFVSVATFANDVLDDTDEQILAAIQEQHRDLAAKTDEMTTLLQAHKQEDRDRDERLRHVSEKTSLRIAGDIDAQVILVVYPDQMVRVIDAKGDWAEVEVYSYTIGEPARGWLERAKLSG